MMDLALYRQFYSEEIEAVSGITTPGLAQAFANVPRERFLPPGPWLFRGESDPGGLPRPTPDADPRRVYHNVPVAIDAPRMLFNGQPAFVGRLIDVLAFKPGDSALHVGCGTGYYTAVIGTVLGERGRVVAFDVDDGLAAGARGNLSALPWIDVRVGNAAGPIQETFDGILVNAGVTHPLDAWLDTLRDGGRIVIPLTVSMAGMRNIGKGVVVLLTKHPSGFSAEFVSFTAIFSAIGLRDESLSPLIGQALQKNPMPRLKTFRRDPHEQAAECWLHTPGFCLST